MHLKSLETRGVILVCLSALAFSFAGIFTKIVEVPAWDVIFWRGISGAAFTVLFLVLRAGVHDELGRFGWSAWIAAALMASGTAAFIPAFKLTTVANVSLIWATAPFVTALFAWLFIREAPTLRVIACSVLALFGVLVTVGTSTSAGGHLGDALALWMTVMMAATMVLYRAYPQTPTRLPAALSSLILLPFAAVLSEPSEATGDQIGILFIFGMVFAAASVLVAEGARLIPSAKAALISALETPLAPIWAALILLERPPLMTVLGGGIIMLAVVFSQKYTFSIRAFSHTKEP